MSSNLDIKSGVGTSRPATDVTQLMNQIKAEVRDELRSIADSSVKSNQQRDQIKIEELNYLNKRYTYPDDTLDPETVSSHWAFIGPLIVATRRFFYRLVRGKLLFNYFNEQRDFQANLVRCLNELTRHLTQGVDRHSEDQLQQLIALEDELRAMIDQSSLTLHQQLSQEVNQNTVLRQRLEVIEQVVVGLEQIIARIGRRERSDFADQLPDYQYLLLENRFRGSEQEILSRVGFYVDELKDVDGAVCEIGSGRGELQRLLKSSGINCFGLELDEAMIEHCQELGLDVRKYDGIKFLAEQADNSLGAVVALQVIEHLPVAVLRNFFELAQRKVKNGGKVIVETINVASLQALRANYFRDPTHAQPLHPDTTSFMMMQAGLTVSEVRFLSPYPSDVEFEIIESDPEFPPRFREAIEKMNRNSKRLNEIFFGHQDYCVIAEVKK